jgi:hypothetical protein
MIYAKSKHAMTFGVVMLYSSVAAQAAPMFDFLPSASNVSFDPNGVTVGYKFEVTAGSVSVDGIGLLDMGSAGLDSAHEVALWDASSNIIINPEILNPGSPASNSDPSDSLLGSYIYKDISPVVLGVGQYVLGVSYLANANNDLAVSALLADVVTDPGSGNVVFLGGVFGFGSGVNVAFPDYSGGTNNYFGPALRLSSNIVVGEPLTLALFTVGIVGMGWRRRQAPRLSDVLPA